jgi:RecA-family ATPase
VSSAEFVKGFVPPDYLVEGLVQRRYFYSLTGRTGDGKTSIALLLAACVALGALFAGRPTEKGRALVFAGENPDDIRARWIGLSEMMTFDVETIDVHFIPGAFKISELIKRIKQEVKALGGVDLIIVDTSAVYFEGDDKTVTLSKASMRGACAAWWSSMVAPASSSTATRPRTPPMTT